jgi:hypothetical protein
MLAEDLPKRKADQLRRYAPWIVIGILSWCLYSLRESSQARRAGISLEVGDVDHSTVLSQMEGLMNADVIVHRVYDYRGYTWIEPIEGAKRIAVDVEFRNYRLGIDLDDVDILNGETKENYGSDPDIARLNLDGTLAADFETAELPVNLGPMRVLLIYAFPESVNAIMLSYWGQELTPKPIPITGDGPELPKPDPESESL